MQIEKRKRAKLIDRHLNREGIIKTLTDGINIKEKQENGK